MISFVCWKWDVAGGRLFQSEYVNTLARMIERNYPAPHRFICMTESDFGLASYVEAIRPPRKSLDHLQSHHGPRFPSCYRRLWNFSQEAVEILGPRICALDIDVIVTGDIRQIVDRREYFVGWTDDRFAWNKVAGGLYLLTTGSLTRVWSDFDPVFSPGRAVRAGCHGSDQGWMSYKLYPPPARFESGVVSIKWLQRLQPLPPQARIVSTPGELKPWSSELQRRYPWIREHWK